MRYSEIIRTVAYCAIWVVVSVSCKQETPTATGKKVFPWFVYKDWNSFKDIEPVKEIINSISVFGNPPKSFIDECHRSFELRMLYRLPVSSMRPNQVQG